MAVGKNEILTRFSLLLEEIEENRDAEDLAVSRDMFKKAVDLLADTDVRKAGEFVECFEGTLKFYNFLTEHEAEEIVSKFLNQDGSRGAKWKNPEDFFLKIQEFKGKIECEPHYNKWALYATIHKFYSDQHNAIMKWVSGDADKYLEACYDLAVAQLEDKDKPCWVRWYFSAEH